MMEPAKDRLGSHIAAGSYTRLRRRCTGRTLAQTPMRLPLIVIIDVPFDGSLQMLVARNQLVVQAFIANTPDPSLCDRIGSRRLDRRTDLANCQGFDAPVEYGTEAAITDVNQVSGTFR